MHTTTKAGRRVARKKAEVRVDTDGNFVPGPSELVSYPEITAMFRVSAITPHQWRQRVETTRFPEPFDHVGGQPMWRVADVCRWAQQSGREFFLTPDWVKRLEL
jgi:hypothetical protein